LTEQEEIEREIKEEKDKRLKLETLKYKEVTINKTIGLVGKTKLTNRKNESLFI
jgi:hypothetical protein